MPRFCASALFVTDRFLLVFIFGGIARFSRIGLPYMASGKTRYFCCDWLVVHEMRRLLPLLYTYGQNRSRVCGPKAQL